MSIYGYKGLVVCRLGVPGGEAGEALLFQNRILEAVIGHGGEGV